MTPQNYNVFFRASRRHKWRYKSGCWLVPFEGLSGLRDILRDRLSRLPREQGKTPGYGIVRDNSGITLMSMSKATWRRIPHSEKALIEPRAGWGESKEGDDV